MKIEFVKSPTGVFKMAYSAGEQAELDDKTAKNLIDDGYAIALDEPKPKAKRASKKK